MKGNKRKKTHKSKVTEMTPAQFTPSEINSSPCNIDNIIKGSSLGIPNNLIKSFETDKSVIATEESG